MKIIIFAIMFLASSLANAAPIHYSLSQRDNIPFPLNFDVNPGPRHTGQTSTMRVYPRNTSIRNAVRREMRKMALEAEIENAGRSIMGATGGVSAKVIKPSREALEAFEAGLLDSTGPAGETDFVERARALEEEEKR